MSSRKNVTYINGFGRSKCTTEEARVEVADKSQYVSRQGGMGSLLAPQKDTGDWTVEAK